MEIIKIIGVAFIALIVIIILSNIDPNLLFMLQLQQDS